MRLDIEDKTACPFCEGRRWRCLNRTAGVGMVLHGGGRMMMALREAFVGIDTAKTRIHIATSILYAMTGPKPAKRIPS